MTAVERRALAATLRTVGPDAPTAIDRWSAGDLAAHVASSERLRGAPAFLARTFVRRTGIRLNDALQRPIDLDRRRFSRRGFEWAVGRLERRHPALLERPSVRPLTLLELFVHHEEVRRPNGLARSAPMPDVDGSLVWLLGYQRKLLGAVRLRLNLPDGRRFWAGGGGPAVTVTGAVPELVLWLAGRSTLADVEVDAPADVILRLRV